MTLTAVPIGAAGGPHLVAGRKNLLQPISRRPPSSGRRRVLRGAPHSGRRRAHSGAGALRAAALGFPRASAAPSQWLAWAADEAVAAVWARGHRCPGIQRCSAAAVMPPGRPLSAVRRKQCHKIRRQAPAWNCGVTFFLKKKKKGNSPGKKTEGQETLDPMQKKKVIHYCAK